MTAVQTPSDRAFASAMLKFEMLDHETEKNLAIAWRDKRCCESLQRLVNAHMRLAMSIAGKYRRYGAAMSDLTQEAGLGLMKAAERFDPDRGVRFSTFARWWVKAAVQDFVMRDWSLVRTGSTAPQKALFFGMRGARARLERSKGPARDGAAAHEIRVSIAEEVGVPLRDVEMMEGRLAGSDFSLNAARSGEESNEWIELLEDETPVGAETASHELDIATAGCWVREALMQLSERERLIIRRRKLDDEPATLEALGNELGISKERVRQLEAQALATMKRNLLKRHGEAPALMALAH